MRMLSVSAIVLLAFASWETFANQTNETLYPKGKAVDKLMGKLFDRGIQPSPLKQAGLDEMVLAKNHLDRSRGIQFATSALPFSRSPFAIPRSALSGSASQSQLPAASSHLSRSFSMGGQFRSAHKVVAQAVAVGDAWANHFSAFSEQDVDKILKDYTEQSVVTVYNTVTSKKDVYKGLTGVKLAFEVLFKNLFDTSDLAAPVQVVEEASADGPGNVFLIWSAAASGVLDATDTFLFDKHGKILRQNVVLTYENPNLKELDPPLVSDSDATKDTGPVHDAWKNHFGAFGTQDVGKILQDYTDRSIITVYNQVNGKKTVYKGLEGVKTSYTALFDSLPDVSDHSVPIIHVEQDSGDGTGQVFLIWSAATSGYADATDTFIFDKDGKIFRQNVVLHYTKPIEQEMSAGPK